jgi:putative addiction module component (TIGR02574 family)
VSYELSELLNLGTPEKLRLIDALWDSIGEPPPMPIHLTPQQQAEIRRRDAEMDMDPTSCVEWSQVDRLLEPDDA